MKRRFNYILLLLLIIGGVFYSCNDDPSGKPEVKYIRLTDPEKADSAFTNANLGQLIVIIGENLGTLHELYFNDLEASLNPAYITNTSVIVNIPKKLPAERNDKITMIFADGYQLQVDFTVDIAPPVITGIKSEHVVDGDVAVIYGEYLFEPTVIFAGDLKGEIVESKETEIQVKVPAGAQTGKIKVVNNIGTAESDFIFRDTTGMVVNFDNKLHETWTAPITYIDSVKDAEPCNGNYASLIASDVKAWDWKNGLSMQYLAQEDVPIATGNPFQYNLKFEVNVPVEWYDVRMEIYFAPFGEGHGRDYQVDGAYFTSFYRWQPWVEGPYITDGWVTISIPLGDFNYGHDDGDVPPDQGTNPLGELSQFSNLTMMIFGPITLSETYPVEVRIDNIRIVPNGN